MKQFMTEDFLLSTETAKRLWRENAKVMPIIDYHCHIDPAQIARNDRATNITELWLYGDHYKWRAMRSCGVPEKYITGDASDYEKFRAFASIMPRLAGNPIYHWSHLELRRYFGWEGVLSEETCDECWKVTSDVLARGLSVREIIEMSNVEALCTTDDPADSLEWHEKIAADESFKVKVLPAFRPDKAMGCAKKGYRTYIESLAAAAGTKITDFDSLCRALSLRLDFFAEHGALTADHGLDTRVCFAKAKCDRDVDDIFKRCAATDKPCPTEEEEAIFKTALLRFLAGEYRRRGWVMQIHFGVLRNVNDRIFAKLGPDTGFDVMGSDTGVADLARLLSAFVEDGGLPRTILYSINPGDNEAVAALCGAFQPSDDGMPRCLQGSAWWFCDHEPGMRAQLTAFSTLSALGVFPGMLTDSRSFLSYTRHEYFRRILCDLVGEWIESGRLPDTPHADKLIRDICYNNTKNYFKF